MFQEAQLNVQNFAVLAHLCREVCTALYLEM